MAIAIPADGPSFGMAPAGTCRWTSCRENQSLVELQLLGVRAHPRQRRLRRLLHHLAELACHSELAPARVRLRLDVEDVAADRRVREPGRHAGVGGAPAGLGREAARPEPLARELLGRRRSAPRCPRATCTAAFRQRSPIRRSSPRTPASRVYSRARSRNTASPISIRSRVEPVLGDLPWHEVALRDPELLLLGVAGELDHVHPVEQRPVGSCPPCSPCR